MAKATGQDYVETDLDTIKRFCGPKYEQFCMDFMGVKVWAEGHVPEGGEELPISTEQWMRNKQEENKIGK